MIAQGSICLQKPVAFSMKLNKRCVKLFISSKIYHNFFLNLNWLFHNTSSKRNLLDAQPSIKSAIRTHSVGCNTVGPIPSEIAFQINFLSLWSESIKTRLKCALRSTKTLWNRNLEQQKKKLTLWIFNFFYAHLDPVMKNEIGHSQSENGHSQIWNGQWWNLTSWG